MSKAKHLLCLGVVLLARASALAADATPEGTYQLSSYVGTNEIHLLLIKFETKDGKLTGTLLSRNPRMAAGISNLDSVVLDGKILRLKVGEQTFEGQLGAKTIRGTWSGDQNINVAQLAPSDLETIEPANAIAQLPVPPLVKAQQLANKPVIARFRAQREKDEQKKAELLKEAEEAAKEAEQELPALYREVIAKYADSPAVFAAGFNLLRDTAHKPTAEEAKKVAEILVAAAKTYGPKLEADTVTQLAELLVKQDATRELALANARSAEKLVGDKWPAEAQVRVLKALVAALRKNNKPDEVKDVEARLAKLEAVLDREYLVKMPPFKPGSFAGRKAKSKRVAVMELFTGAQCPPCVAADVAFDALEKTYKPVDVILLQYHMHIPGPDPLTNPDSEARWKYYSDKFPQDIRGTPSTIFNGTPKLGGGGPLARAEFKYNEYCKALDPLLEEAAAARLTAQATRHGNRIDVKADVVQLDDPSESKRLRLVLVEESIRYVGSNRLRFHHHVVRAFPGGVEGLPLKNKSAQQSVSVNLHDVRKNLEKYLSDFAAKRPFPYADRPLDMKHLKLVAFIQDDSTREILQAVQVDVDREPGASAQ
jgi:hypothetical protein